MKKSVRAYITGTVQGVFFREFIREKAEACGVKGYVRNLDDGRVEVWIEGNNKEVKEMLEACKEGPQHASIRRMDLLEEKYQGFKEFKVITI
ncbi:acylphosphatase [Candidatus Pacearchaeota archaeon CG10_big_fil_rev_8_21_14_0_10_35_13]|nr:MAG: acylphosphatase [Candidatus Pacearchaeota archaeon CG10_big_fil_rev_8_21_14_0_10_35_13]